MTSENVETTTAESSSRPRPKLSLMQKLERRVRADPAVFGFLGLTVAALTGGMVSLLRDDKRQSQLMMRARVGFQFCAILALVGGIYYRAYQGSLHESRAAVPKTTQDFAGVRMDEVNTNNSGQVVQSGSQMR
jgi:hypothetical protein